MSEKEGEIDEHVNMLPVMLGVGVFLFLLVFTAVLIRICKKHKKFLCQYLILNNKHLSNIALSFGTC